MIRKNIPEFFRQSFVSNFSEVISVTMSKVGEDTQLIHLNVGGTEFVTTRYQERE